MSCKNTEQSHIASAKHILRRNRLASVGGRKLNPCEICVEACIYQLRRFLFVCSCKVWYVSCDLHLCYLYIFCDLHLCYLYIFCDLHLCYLYIFCDLHLCYLYIFCDLHLCYLYIFCDLHLCYLYIFCDLHLCYLYIFCPMYIVPRYAALGQLHCRADRFYLFDIGRSPVNAVSFLSPGQSGVASHNVHRALVLVYSSFTVCITILDAHLMTALFILFSTQGVNVKTEEITLADSAKSLDANSLASRVPDDSPRYHFYVFKHTFESDYMESFGMCWKCCH